MFIKQNPGDYAKSKRTERSHPIYLFFLKYKDDFSKTSICFKKAIKYPRLYKYLTGIKHRLEAHDMRLLKSYLKELRDDLNQLELED